MPPAQKKTVTRPAALLEADSAVPKGEPAPAEPEAPAAEPVRAVLEDVTPGAPDAAEAELDADSRVPGPGSGGDGDKPSEPEGPVEPDLVNVAEPCPKCYPNGWFEGATEGVRATCPDMTIVYGEFVALERALALELGYADRSAEKQ